MPSQDNSSLSEQKTGISFDKKNYFFSLSAFIILSTITIGVAYFFSFQETQKESETATIDSEPLIVQQLAPEKLIANISTPKEASYTLKIMNASGITGLAGKMKKTLETEAKKEGWSSLTITTGNTSNQTGTTLTFKKENFETTELGQLIQQSLPNSTIKIDLQQREDILIILGK